MVASQCKSIQSFQILRTNSPTQTLLIFEGIDWLMYQTLVTPFQVLNYCYYHYYNYYKHCEMPNGLKHMFCLFFQDSKP